MLYYGYNEPNTLVVDGKTRLTELDDGGKLRSQTPLPRRTNPLDTNH